MKQLRILGGLILVALIMNSCIIDEVFDCEHGRGDVEEEEFFVNEFTDVRLGVDADVFITQGDDHHVRVLAQGNILDELDFRVRNRTLSIGRDRCLKDYRNIEVYLTMINIEHLDISGSGSIRGENIFQVRDLGLEISGSGNIDVALEGDDIEARVSGSGDLVLEGQADVLDYRVSGSGDLESFDLQVRRADINISGSGNAEVYVTDFLDVRISGSGDVFYKGDPDIDSRISGSGRIIDAN